MSTSAQLSQMVVQIWGVSQVAGKELPPQSIVGMDSVRRRLPTFGLIHQASSLTRPLKYATFHVIHFNCLFSTPPKVLSQFSSHH